MEEHRILNNREAQSRPAILPGSAALYPVETLKEPRKVLCRNALAGIIEEKFVLCRTLIWNFAALQMHLNTTASMLYCIIYQVFK